MVYKSASSVLFLHNIPGFYITYRICFLWETIYFIPVFAFFFFSIVEFCFIFNQFRVEFMIYAVNGLFILFYFTCMSDHLLLYICFLCMPGICVVQKRASDILEGSGRQL